MSVNVQCHTPVNLSPRKRWVAQDTEGLVRIMPSVLLLIDSCLRNKLVKEVKLAIVGK
jgi:hypothetical protein